jgi:hypothetical protein
MYCKYIAFFVYCFVCKCMCNVCIVCILLCLSTVLYVNVYVYVLYVNVYVYVLYVYVLFSMYLYV